MSQQEAMVDEQMIREQIRRELEESMHVERELLRQQLRDEMRLEIHTSSSRLSPTNIISPASMNDNSSHQHDETIHGRLTPTPSSKLYRPSALSSGSSVVIAKQQERANMFKTVKPHTQSASELASTNQMSKSPTSSLSSYIGSANPNTDISPHNGPMMPDVSTSNTHHVERRGSSESDLTSLDSNVSITGINSDNGMDVATMSSMQTELKKYHRKVDFLTKENVALKSIVRSDNNDGPVIRNDRDIRDRASMQATVHSLKSDLERMTNNINQMKDEKAQMELEMHETWSQLTAELELSNAQRDDYARKLENEKEAIHEQNRMTVLFLASKRVDPMIIQELRNMFGSSESHHHSSTPRDDMHGSSQKSHLDPYKSNKPHPPINDNHAFDDDMSMISSVSTHREHPSSIDDNSLAYDNYHHMQEVMTSHHHTPHHITPLHRAASTSARLSPPRALSMQKSFSISTNRPKSRSNHDSNENPGSRQFDGDNFAYESNPYAKQQASHIQQVSQTSSHPPKPPSTSSVPASRMTSNMHISTSTPNPTPPVTSKFGQKPKQYEEEASIPATSPAASSTGGKELLDQTANLLNWMVPGLWQSPSQS